MKRLHWLSLVAGLGFIGCEKRMAETVHVEVPAIRASYIYHPDSVYQYKSAHLDFNKEMALSYFQKAKDAEGNNITQAIYFVKRGITLQPTLEYYKYLATLLTKTEQYDELQDLYNLLVIEHTFKALKGEEVGYLFEKPDEELLYNALSAYLIKYQYLPYEELEEAKKLNISLTNLKQRLMADKRFSLDPSSEEYKDLMLQFLSEEELEKYAQSEGNFQNFLSSIKDTTNTFSINEKEIANFAYDVDEDESMNAYNYYEFYLQEKQENPEEWYNFNLKHKINLPSGSKAVLYAIDTSARACPVNMRHVYYRLVTYSPDRKIIDSKVVATQAGEELSTVAFEPGKITVTDYKRSWKNPYKKEDFDNYLLKTEKVGTHDFSITPEGKIVALTSPATSVPDSLLVQTSFPK